MQQQNIISSSCRATPTKYTHLLISLISLIFLSVLIEAPPTPPDLTSIPNLQRFANYASAAYSKVPLEHWNCGTACQATPGTTLVKTFNNDDFNTRGYIALDQDKQLIIVSYRGTERGNIRNLMTDLNFFTKRYTPVDGTKVHSGFYNAFLGLQDDVTDDVINLHNENPDFSIGFMGHSLGGAIATFSALDVLQLKPALAKSDQLFLATFGQPRVGDVAFSQYVQNNIKSVARTIVRGDPIPRMPPNFPIPFVGTYEHFGEEFYINNPDQDPDEFVECVAEDRDCSGSVPLTQLRFRYHSGPYYGVNMRSSQGKSLGDEDNESEDYDFSADPIFSYNPNYNYTADPRFVYNPNYNYSGIPIYGVGDTEEVNGIDGAKEVNGVDGAAKGVKGVNGAKGVKGVDGAKGVKGVDSAKGVKGVDGAKEVKNVDGAKGVKGVDNAKGVKGVGNDN